MAFIHSVATQPAVLQNSPEAQLGTGNLDFMSFLLGHQAGQKAEWWQTGTEQAGLPRTEESDALKFGQDAALPIAADALLALFAPGTFDPNQKVPSETLQPVSDGSKAVSAAAGITGDLPKLAAADIQQLLKTPVEKLKPEEVQKVVQFLWGDVKSVKVDDLKTEPHIDSTQHGILQHLARVESAKADVKASAVPSEASNVAREEVSLSVKPGFEQAVRPQTEKKEQKHESSAFSLSSPASPFDLADVGSKPEVGSQHASAAKLMPQVLPRVENLVQQGGGTVTMQLDPPELGRVTIEVTTRGKHVELSIRSDNDATRAALEGGLADLRQAMQSQDLQLARADVQVDRNPFSSMQFEQGGGREHASAEGERSFYGREEKLWLGDSLSSVAAPLTRSTGRLDVRV